MAKRPELPGGSNAELDKAQDQFDAFEDNVKSLSLDKMNEAPLKETESKTKLSQSEIFNSKDIYLKPKRYLASREKFNEKYRNEYNFKKEYVNFTAEHKEIIGEKIECWTKPFPGLPAEFWELPANTPVWGPRYLAEQIKGCKYHVMKTAQNVTNEDHSGQYFGQMVVTETKQRLDAVPVNRNRSIFMGASGF